MAIRMLDAFRHGFRKSERNRQTSVAAKLMYLADCYEGPCAGTERQLLQLLRRCDRSRYDPAITVLRRSDYIEQNSLGCPIQVLGVVKLASVRSIYKILRFAVALRRQGYRLVHCFFNDVSLIAPPLLRMCGIRVLVSRRDMGFWYSPGKLAVLRLVSVFVDRYLVNSRAVAQVVQKREGVPARKISVIYNGIVPAAGDPRAEVSTPEMAPLPTPERVVGIVANLKTIKRIDVLIRAMALVCERVPEARLVVVGRDGPSARGPSMRQELEHLAATLRIGDVVTFAGGVDDPLSYINRFTVAVLCSESEGFSNALIEYMQAGRPVVCTNTGGNSELVQDGINGFLIPVGDVGRLADRLVQLLSDSALASALGAAARATVCSLSDTRMIEEHLACYDEVMSICRPKRGFKSASSIAQ